MKFTAGDRHKDDGADFIMWDIDTVGPLTHAAFIRVVCNDAGHVRDAVLDALNGSEELRKITSPHIYAQGE